MSLHKLSAGHGYDYLIRQVAALDATHRGRADLAAYYDERGESPGRWIGRGLTGIAGLKPGEVVTGEQMRLLFAEGRHPLAESGQGGGGSLLLLGVPFRVPRSEEPFQAALRARFADHNDALGLPAHAALPAGERARLRGELALEWFRVQEGRDPEGELELSSALARWSRPAPSAVGGYDLTFSPVKSVSTLWAIADPQIAARIEGAHQAAVGEALRFIEDRALFTREGTAGARQVNVTGLVAAVFTHRDSRAGDPDLHTHVAVANKLQTLAGRWLSIDGRVLHAAKVSASETYNTALEQHLTASLGLRFADRAGGAGGVGLDRSKRPVREIVGVDPRLNRRWSTRRQAVDARTTELAAEFAGRHGRAPVQVESLQLAQQATLETREHKHEPRSLAAQRQAWRAEAIQVLGGPERVAAMLHTTLNPPPVDTPARTEEWGSQVADRVIAVLEEHRSTWNEWHVWAETQRQLRGAPIDPAHGSAIASWVVHAAVNRSVRLTPADDTLGVPAGRAEIPPAEIPPEGSRRVDGSSVFTVAGTVQYSSARILAAEQRLLAAADKADGFFRLSLETVDRYVTEAAEARTVLDAGQVAMVRKLANDKQRVQLAIAPAGAGKTTALKVLADAWTGSGGHIIGLTPSATAAAQLAEATGMQTDTLARLAWAINHHQPLPEWAAGIKSRTMLVIDEAGMADTLTLDTVITYICGSSGSFGRVCLVGDDRQLGAIGAGGILTDLEAVHGAARLTQLHRFTDPAEAAATLQVRAGNPAALDFYTGRDRIHVAHPTELPARVVAAWHHDQQHGLDSVMLANYQRQVDDLNHRARTLRLGGHPPDREVELADGNQASVGDLIITRRNNRRLGSSPAGGSWVRNGDRWTITALTPDGGIEAHHRRTGHHVVLPTGYVQESVQLGYATTVNTAQGITVDTTHSLIHQLTSREQLYTMLSRGRAGNHLYVLTGAVGIDPRHIPHTDLTEPVALETLQRILVRTGERSSATRTRDRLAKEPGESETQYWTRRRQLDQEPGWRAAPRGPGAPRI